MVMCAMARLWKSRTESFDLDWLHGSFHTS
jgi:hypothetical protein